MIKQFRHIIRVVFILIILSSHVTLVAAGQDRALKNLYYSNTSGEKGVTTYYYNRKGENFRCTWVLDDASRSSMNYHEFDSTGNLIRKYREFTDKITSETRYEYKGNRLVSETYKRSDGKKGSAVYQYDIKGRKIKAECNNRDGWFTGIIEYQYQDSDKPVRAEIKKGGRPIGSILYNYENGYLRKEVWNMGQWKQQFLYEYEKPAGKRGGITWATPYIKSKPGQLIAGEEYSFNGETGGPSTYKYRNGLLHKKFFERSDKMKTETEYFYDRDRVLLESKRKYSDGKTAKFFYIYNKKRQLTHRYFLRSDGLRGQERYFYISGELTSAKLENFDSWLSGTITFTPGPNGMPAKGKFISREFTANLIFTYNQNNNLTVLRWNFSVGKYQEYKFTYKQQ